MPTLTPTDPFLIPQRPTLFPRPQWAFILQWFKLQCGPTMTSYGPGYGLSYFCESPKTLYWSLIVLPQQWHPLLSPSKTLVRGKHTCFLQAPVSGIWQVFVNPSTVSSLLTGEPRVLQVLRVLGGWGSSVSSGLHLHIPVGEGTGGKGKQKKLLKSLYWAWSLYTLLVLVSPRFSNGTRH